MVAPRLRRSMAALGALLLLVALITSLALVVLTTMLRRDATSIAIADARVRASLRTKVALLWYARESDAALTERSTAAELDQSQAESDLRSALAETRRLAAIEHSARLDRLQRMVASYVQLRDRLDASGVPLALVLERSKPALEAAFGAIQELIAANEAWSRSVEAAARRWDAIADWMGLSAAVVLTLGFGTAIVGMGRLVVLPTLGLTETMARFARGEESARGVERGARELRQTTATFNDLAERLVRQKRDRLAFLSGVAHDLRNPLAALRLAMEALRRGEQPPAPERVARTLERVERQLDRLDRMVGDLLDATRIEAGQLELRLETADLRALVTHVTELLAPSADSHEIVVHVPTEPVRVDCDPARIEQVLINLVGNAIKYSPGGGRVRLDVIAQEAAAAVAVTDQGIGIPPEERERIFEPFRRTEASRAVAPGVGLGLSVARKIVEAHGGRIEVESEVGHGSTFRVRLPIEHAR